LLNLRESIGWKSLRRIPNDERVALVDLDRFIVITRDYRGTKIRIGNLTLIVKSEKITGRCLGRSRGGEAPLISINGILRYVASLPGGVAG
jgi:hypothetical protein